ncbi:MAG: Rossmann-like and DUF2520 domain-containing protein, partial [Bacteroidota bacterium]
MSPKASIIGAGKLAWSLIPALQNAGVDVIQLISRSAKSRNTYAETYRISQQEADIALLNPEAKLVFLCVPDQSIPDLARRLKGFVQPNQILLHSSGSTPLSKLQIAGGQSAVLYPMQIFTPGARVDFTQVPIFVEAGEEAFPLVERLAQSLSERVYPLNSEGRLRLHMGAVIACNFSNWLYRWAEKAMPQLEGIDFRIYEPLVREQVEKVFRFLPGQTQ